MGRTCKGLCVIMKADSLPNRLRYVLGQKRCTFCGCFFSTEDIRCPCCKAVLRTKPRSKKMN